MITVEHLTKRYGNFTAVDDLSFEIEEGHVYGFLGPNGAGKSTTMNIMTGCLSATAGHVTIDGYDIFEEPDRAKRLIPCQSKPRQGLRFWIFKNVFIFLSFFLPPVCATLYLNLSIMLN